VLQRALELAEVHALVIRHGEQRRRRTRAIPGAGHRASKAASPRPVVARRAGRRARQPLQLGAREATLASTAPVVLVARHRAQRARARAHRAHVAPVQPLEDVALALKRQALERHGVHWTPRSGFRAFPLFVDARLSSARPHNESCVGLGSFDRANKARRRALTFF